MLIRTPSRWSVAVRRPDGEIHTEVHTTEERWRVLRRSFVRGLAALADALSVGLQALQIAVRVTGGIQTTPGQIRSTLAAVGAGMLAVFVVAPAVFASTRPDATADVLEASGRAAVLVVYLLAVSRSPGARRLFAYHGAEHMVIAAFERTGGLPTIDQAREHGPVHSRCGTNFISLFVIVAGVVHAFVPREPLPAAALWRILLVPVDAAIAYEVMRAAARSTGVLGRLVNAPGRALQRITTRAPTDDQIHVALAALAPLTA